MKYHYNKYNQTLLSSKLQHKLNKYNNNDKLHHNKTKLSRSV